MVAGGIVVGMDGSEASRRALRWAAEEASLRGVELHAVHAWDLPGTAGLAAPPSVREARARAAGARAHRWVREVLGDHAHEVTVWERQAPAGPLLVEMSRDAALLVLGTREHTGLRRIVAGSVSHYCLSHADCPVVAVPPPRRVPLPRPAFERGADHHAAERPGS